MLVTDGGADAKALQGTMSPQVTVRYEYQLSRLLQ